MSWERFRSRCTITNETSLVSRRGCLFSFEKLIYQHPIILGWTAMPVQRVQITPWTPSDAQISGVYEKRWTDKYWSIPRKRTGRLSIFYIFPSNWSPYFPSTNLKEKDTPMTDRLRYLPRFTITVTNHDLTNEFFSLVAVIITNISCIIYAQSENINQLVVSERKISDFWPESANIYRLTIAINWGTICFLF